jgi:peptidoglycan hydrolase CwlO-like protein
MIFILITKNYNILAMKKKIYLIAMTMLLTVAAFNSNAATANDDKNFYKEAAANMTKEQKEARVEEIKMRVQEIKAMDKSDLNKAEKKELKNELKNLKHEAQAMGGGGVYLSVGAIIIIILILILIL